jgi:hypothetical protein
MVAEVCASVAQGRVQVGVLADDVVDGRMDHEHAVDPRHVDQDVAVAVGDHTPGIAFIRGAEHHVDLDAARLQLIGEGLQASAFGGGPIAAVAHARHEGDNLAHRLGKHLQPPQAVARPCGFSAAVTLPKSNRNNSGS